VIFELRPYVIKMTWHEERVSSFLTAHQHKIGYSVSAM